MSILKTITAYKLKEVEATQKAFPISLLEKSNFYNSATISLKNALLNQPISIIAEHKRKSPSKNTINNTVTVDQVVLGYETAGAAALSILTDSKFFGGSLTDLLVARNHTTLPILRKDFMVTTYQIYETKAYGADAILLIAACLTSKEINEFSKLAKKIGLEVLVEIHNEEELQKALQPTVDIIGVNNRNLKTFEVSIQNSLDLVKNIPSSFIKISESGIQNINTINHLKSAGYQGFLIGETFMKEKNPGKALQNFLT